MTTMCEKVKKMTEGKRKTRRSSYARTHASIGRWCADSLFNWMPQIAKATGISRDRAKRCALKPTEAHKMPTDGLASRHVFPQKP